MGQIAKRLTDPAIRERMKRDMSEGTVYRADDWSQVIIPSSANPAHIGRSVSEMAEEAGKSPFDWVFDALLETGGNIGTIMHSMSEDNVQLEMRHPKMMFGTDGFGLPLDGPLAVGAPHPRNFGTFPRILGKYVREDRVISLEEAIWKACGFPAQKLRLQERGLLCKGYKADLVLFNPETIVDKATFLKPFQRSLGIENVIVNGKLVMDHGVHTQARPGVVLTRQ